MTNATETRAEPTPGPWKTDSRWPDTALMASDPDDPGFIKRVAEVCYASDADFCLIRAAPELLEALETLRGCLDRYGFWSDRYSSDLPDDLQVARGVMNDAIAKARGEQ